MREIKFRVWSKHTKKMFYEGFYISQNGDLFQNDSLDYKNKDSFEVMQYTGLKDKNGKDIYERDILKVTTVRGDTRWQMEVDFENGCFALKEGPELWKLKYDYPNHEVIGNIYENPELLNGVGDTE